ncbi:MAG: glycosyltransferase, partial [Verrucomicrobiota bacterium]
VLVEAMACGKPLVACSLKSGVPFVCRDGVNGLLVPPGDSAGLRRAVDRLLSSPALRERLGSAGRRLAEAEFSATVMLDRTLALFQRLVAGGSRP